MEFKEICQILRKSPSGINELSDSQGGYCVSTELSEAITQDMIYASPLVSSVKIAPASGGVVQLHRLIDENGYRAGVYWVGEGDQKTPDYPRFSGRVSRLHKLVALIPVTEEILNDNERMVYEYTRGYLVEHYTRALESAIVSGNGNYTIHGIANTGSQSTVTVTTPNPLTANALRLYVDSLSPTAKNAAWFVSKTRYGEILDLIASGALPVAVCNYEAGALWLYGRRVYELGSLASPVDIILGDFSHYLLAVRGLQSDRMESAIKIEVGLKYQTDEKLLRCVIRMQGDATTITTKLPDDPARVVGSFVVPYVSHGGTSV